MLKRKSCISCVTLLLMCCVICSSEVELYGDIPVYANERADLKIYYRAPNNENKCYKDVPSVLYQTQEFEMVHGNASSPDFFRLEICCEGYKRSHLNNGQCVADCSKISSDNCRHGFCRSPSHCECYEGFVLNAEGNCIQTCPVACENGRCLLDGTCICNQGYYLDLETRKYCVPDCSHIACGLNQRCVGPGQCGCARGYEWLDGLGCQPICQPHCGHGRCVAPGECECFGGYMKRPGRNICESECFLNCDNGFCESRYKCQCHVGFYYEPHLQTCLPSCPHACEHGVCIAPGICRCFEGYYLHDNTCLPICENGCGPYGHCIAPNVCACGKGHHKCLAGGRCSQLGKCYCPAGLTRFLGSCSSPLDIDNFSLGYEQRLYYDRELKYEFQALVGRLFQFYD